MELVLVETSTNLLIMNSTCMNFIPIAIKICTSGIGTSGDCTSGGLPVSETVLSGDPLYQVVVEVTHRLF